MANFPSLKLIEVCKVSPPPAAAAPSSLPLTFFDLVWLRNRPVKRLFFYEFRLNETSFHDVIVPKLKSSLSLTLRHYLPVAGNLVWPSHSDVPVIEFVEGNGVSMTVAESDDDFYYLSGNGFREASKFHPLVPELSLSDDRAAVIAIQVTKFQNKGFSIGITNHHAILDGRSSTSFIKSWAQICIEESSIPIPKQMPLYDRSVINDPKGFTKLYAKAWQDLEGPNNRSLKLKFPKTKHGLVRSTLEFTHQNIQKLREWILNKKKIIKNENFDSSSSHISSFAIAIAYLSVCTAKLEGLKEGKLPLIFPAEGRARLKPQVPLNYFGNCLLGVFSCLERSELLSENGIILACDVISKAIRSLDDGPLNMCESWRPSMPSQDSSKSHAIALSGSPKFGVYNVDFGFGKPKKVEVVSIDQSPNIFSLTESRNSDVAMEIGVVKEMDEMEAFVGIFKQGFESI